MKSKYLIWLVIIVSLLGTIAIYGQLPDQIPRHWNYNGEVDAMGHKSNVFFTALLPAAVYLLMLVVPRIDPKRDNYRKHQKAYSTIILSVVLLLVLIHWITIFATLGFISDVSFAIKLCLGILLIIMGNVMPKLKFNYFAGIRTPWTLANEEVWRKTHRVGGICFVTVGVLLVALSFFQGWLNFVIFMAAILGMTLFLMIYSYLEYKKTEKQDKILP